MKDGAHPKYQQVLFVDSSTNFKFVCGTTLSDTSEREVFEGVEYPVCRVAISSSSHPYFVGGKKFVDTENRIGKFTNKYKAAQQKAMDAKAQVEKEEAKLDAKGKKPAKKK